MFRKLFFLSIIFLTFISFNKADNILFYDPVLKKGDLLKIEIKDYPEGTTTEKIDFDGNIKIPLVGEMKAAELKLSELEQIITTALLPYIKTPEVKIYVEEMCPGIYMLGEVAKVGLYRFIPGMTLLDGLILAGGFSNSANLKKIKIIRKVTNEKTEILKINMQKFLNSGNYKNLPYLASGDIIIVPRKIVDKWRLVMTYLQDAVTIYTILRIVNVIK